MSLVAHPLPRFIPEFVMSQLEDPDNLSQLPDETTGHLLIVIMETGLRANDAIALMLLCLSTRDFACSWVHFDQLIDLADDVPLEASDDVAFAFAFGGSPGHVSLRGLVMLHAHDHCPIDRSVKLSVSAMVDAMLPGGHP